MESSIRPADSYISDSLLTPVKLRLNNENKLARKPQTVPQFFRECCLKFGTFKALSYNYSEGAENEWTTVSYAQYENKVEQVALALIHVGLKPRTSVGILAFNCPEWFYTEYGTILAGGVVAGIYLTNSTEAVFHVLSTSAATVCIVDDAEQMAKVRSIKSRLPLLNAVIQIHEPFDDFVGVDQGYYRWNDLMQMQFTYELADELIQRENNVFANECAMLVYTSGTTGLPKGVMLSHDAIVSSGRSLIATLDKIEQGEERLVSFLPLNHVAAQFCDVIFNMALGGCVYFADRNALKGTLITTLIKVRPTVFFAVPRVYEKFQEKILAVEENSSYITKYLLNKCRTVVQNYHLNRMQGNPSSTIAYWLAMRVVGKVKSALALENCKYLLIGGAPISVDLKKFFLSIDMPLSDSYGSSEIGVISTDINLTNLHSTGMATVGTELRIDAPDENQIGEICARSRNIFMGYLDDMESTEKVIDSQGWLKTGDMGRIDCEGNLLISGRLKEIIVTAGGENIPPVYIENLIKRELPYISNAMLVGDRRKYLTVLLTLKTNIDNTTGLPSDMLSEETINWLTSLDLNYTKLSEVLNIPNDIKKEDLLKVKITLHPRIVKSIEEGISRANKQAISNAQKVHKFSILPQDFSVVSEELGPTLKIRRSAVLLKYADIIENMYQ
ncbi:long-chain-fatty-acid--CoA ligase heimdall-like [Teleopsis dalmanni]|uniref:long-chain-fatty-acid--CoA ligase heimdall-like n=1 Tax=Teleopsis dalmanni TaxID=139649 RepID=UPI0018CF39AB|nr:long-chain-fatty-acid--CoA ligase heimdall-like [Teleopsis dalmanni]